MIRANMKNLNLLQKMFIGFASIFKNCERGISPLKICLCIFYVMKIDFFQFYLKDITGTSQFWGLLLQCERKRFLARIHE